MDNTPADPVAWMYEYGLSRVVKLNRDPGMAKYVETPLYTNPRADMQDELVEEIADLKLSVIAFAATVAVDYAKAMGFPEGHLHPTHYDLLERCGGRMDSFTRAILSRIEGGQ